jgi:hypothetical protein
VYFRRPNERDHAVRPRSWRTVSAISGPTRAAVVRYHWNITKSVSLQLQDLIAHLPRSFVEGRRRVRYGSEAEIGAGAVFGHSMFLATSGRSEGPRSVDCSRYCAHNVTVARTTRVPAVNA